MPIKQKPPYISVSDSPNEFIVIVYNQRKFKLSSIDNFEIGLAKPQDTWNLTDIHSEILAGLISNP